MDVSDARQELINIVEELIRVLEEFVHFLEEDDEAEPVGFRAGPDEQSVTCQGGR